MLLSLWQRHAPQAQEDMDVLETRCPVSLCADISGEVMSEAGVFPFHGNKSLCEEALERELLKGDFVFLYRGPLFNRKNSRQDSHTSCNIVVESGWVWVWEHLGS